MALVHTFMRRQALERSVEMWVGGVDEAEHDGCFLADDSPELLRAFPDLVDLGDQFGLRFLLFQGLQPWADFFEIIREGCAP